jgi:DNA-binding response OmpR family regulator
VAASPRNCRDAPDICRCLSAPQRAGRGRGPLRRYLQPFDLVICDVNLPDGSGLTVADRAKSTGVKVLVMTGQGVSLRPGSLQPYDYLLKPLRLTELLDGIQRRLTGKSGDDSAVVQFPKPGA